MGKIENLKVRELRFVIFKGVGEGTLKIAKRDSQTPGTTGQLTVEIPVSAKFLCLWNLFWESCQLGH